MKIRAEATEVFRALEGLLAAGQRGAIVMVVGVAGSAYRRPGARMLVGPAGRTWGGISAGCLEEDARLHALDAVEEGTAKLLRYDTSDTSEVGLGLGCDGQVEVMVRPFSTSEHALVHEVTRALEDDLVVSLAWEIDTTEPELAICAGSRGEALSILPVSPRGLALVARDSVTEEEARLVEMEGGRAFVECMHPSPRLVVCGGGSDSRPIADLARSVGFTVTVLDHRPGNLQASNFPPSTRLVKSRPGEEGADQSLAGSPMVIIKTHSFVHDLAWLQRVLRTEASYIGLMGPRSRIRRLVEEAGNDPRVYGPVGLDLGARGSEQIAVSVVAELLAVRSCRVPGHLREGRQPIHST